MIKTQSITSPSLGTLTLKQKQRRRFWGNVRKNWLLYVFLLPAFTYLAIFNYAPLYGIQIAFKDFKATLGIWGSPWVGTKHFENFFNSFQFGDLLYNTLTLSIYQMIATIPMPVILALLLNYTTMPKLKKLAQSSTFAPHLISVVVMCGMLQTFSSSSGLFNLILKAFGQEPISFLGTPSLFQTMYVASTVWQRTGYNAVIYIAALSSVSEELHEAATVDGASKLQRVWHIDLPSIMPTMVILIIMAVGNLMSIGFEKSFLLQNDLNLERSEIIATYVYKIGIKGAQYSMSTAVGLFNNAINFVLLITVNRVSRALSGSSLW